MIRINDQHHELYAAVTPETNEFLHVRLLRTTQLTVLFLREHRAKRLFEQTTLRVDDVHHLKAALARLGLRFQACCHGNRNIVERVYREVKREGSSFSDTFSHVEP